MPQDERQRQKALIKKRSKQKAAAQSRVRFQVATFSTPKSIIRTARTLPFFGCWISADWKNGSGLVEVLVAREQSSGDICFGLYLIDKYCLGVKNTLSKVDIPKSVFQDGSLLSELFHETPVKSCSPELAHQMIYASIDYAAQFGFEPEKDFALTQNILEPRGTLKEPEKLKFGKNGKPLFIAGPHDNVDRILKQLEETAGPGNFDYVAGLL